MQINGVELRDRTTKTIHVVRKPRERPDDEAQRILEREDSYEAAVAFAQNRVSSHPYGSPSHTHWVRVAAVLRRLQAGKKDGDKRALPNASRREPRDHRPPWPCHHQTGDYIAAFLARARGGAPVAIRRVHQGRISYTLTTVAGVSRGAGQVVVGARPFYILSGRPVAAAAGQDERLVLATGAVRGFAAEYPKGRDLAEMRGPARP